MKRSIHAAKPRKAKDVGRISKCNFREIERARFARCDEHGSNTGAWERAGKTAEGSAQRETSGSERVKVPWLQRQRPGRAGVRCSRLTLLRRARGFAATSFAFALIRDAPKDVSPER